LFNRTKQKSKSFLSEAIVRKTIDSLENKIERSVKTLRKS